MCAALIAAGAISAAALAQVPEHTILVKGAWPSASDQETPLPESGRWTADGYRNDYFGLTLRPSARWQAGLEGPPPSDGGAYTLAQVVPAAKYRAGKPGHLLITAQDLFFTTTKADGALGLVGFTSEHLDESVYRVEEAPREIRLGQRAFVRFAYESAAAGMHWTILATEVRCHVIEFVFVSTRPQSLDDLVHSMDTMTLPPADGAERGVAADMPVCIKDYASADNIVEREEPVLTEPRFNPIPVRIIIDAQGRVRHIHFLRAFPDQASAITQALHQWRFKPHLVGGRPVEVETGMVFGAGRRSS